ncbi:PREDICTED: zinc metalloproteinase nas-4-like isoform X1 [Branchiostoma belcheri]|uniref:Metalloendopeptidase n=2 Tax=Branchiostoma belcheri TaxID=7741 RepID=A0A6P4YVM7_BRABE|nr:PREDICTED: zinc metalloproteinase nas-4-like isoform X1 [Branchiostoma belcheri]
MLAKIFTGFCCGFVTVPKLAVSLVVLAVVLKSSSGRMGKLDRQLARISVPLLREGYPLGHYQEALRTHDDWTTQGAAVVVVGKRVTQEDNTIDNNAIHHRRKRKAIRSPHMRWPHGIIPYTFDVTFSSYDQSIVIKAMRHWEEHTCLKFVALGSPQARHLPTDNYIKFVKDRGCWSKVGMFWWTAEQKLSLGNECLQSKYAVAIAVHEMGHAIGFFHEHARPDRNNYVTIQWDNIRWGRYRHFFRFGYNMIDTFDVPYDYLSIMHYADNEFSWNAHTLRTIETRDPAYQNIIGQRISLSFLDIKMTNQMYNCAARCPSYVRCTKPNSFVGPTCRCMCPGYHGLGTTECPHESTQIVHGYGPHRHRLDCYQGNGNRYRGSRSWTRSGHACLNWSNTLDRDVSTLSYPHGSAGIGNHNFCRNPYPGSPQPWCYVGDIRIFWEYCEIPRCDY